MLPFRVIQLAEYRFRQQNAAKLYLARPSLRELSADSHLATPKSAIPGGLLLGNASIPCPGKAVSLPRKNDGILRGGCTTSTRSWSKIEVTENKPLNPFYPGPQPHLKLFDNLQK
jgi:hypothetical protein